MDPDYVYETINSIYNDIINGIDNDELAEKYKEFSERCVQLYAMILEKRENFDFEKLNRMLSLRRKIINNETDIQTASVSIGKKIAMEYIPAYKAHLDGHSQ